MRNFDTRLINPRATRASWSSEIAANLLNRLHHGSLTVVEGGMRKTYGQPDSEGIHATVTVHDPSVWRRVLVGGGVGLGEAYFLGAWDSDNLVNVLRLLTLNIDRINNLTQRVAPLRAVMHGSTKWRRTPSKNRDRQNIHAHYDLGDEFFELFLDPTMAYSSGVYSSPLSTLEEASTNKFDRICRKLSLGPGDHVVEIGCGWGGFAIHAASRYGCRVTTTTISEHQFTRATAAVAAAGLSDRVTVLNQDYRDLAGNYSHLVSIEMIEAVDWRLHDTFFKACERLLRPDGRAALQCIVIDDREYERAKTTEDFIKRFVFPGGGLPSVTAIAQSVTRATDLRITDLEDIGPHYARTLTDWRQRLEARWHDARGLGFDDQFLRLWRYYLAYCIAGFAERRISVIQMVMARPDWRGTLNPREV